MRVIIAPSRYIQGPGVLNNLKKVTETLGERFFILSSSGGLKRFKNRVIEGFQSEENLTFEEFNGECSKREIKRLTESLKASKSDAVIGLGGGKILDTAKAVAHYAAKPVVIIPTSASTDAPCSALSVLYTDSGEFQEYLFLHKNPDMVIMDSEVIAKAPSRLLISGMGDALSTYFEARACEASKAPSCTGGQITKAAVALSKLCYETLINDGLKAALAVKTRTVTPALENIIEANTYLSGIGFESGGLAGAHAIHNGLTVLSATQRCYHGEKVAFSTIVQLFLESAPLSLIDEAVDFCISVGLPVTLAELGVKDAGDEQLFRVAEAASAEGETIHNMPFKVTAESVYRAIRAADDYGSIKKK